MAPSKIPRPIARFISHPRSRSRRARPYARNNRTTRNSPSGNNFRCFVEALRGEHAHGTFPSSCSNPKKTMRALKEHVKKIHGCNCPDGEGNCLNPVHLTSSQLERIEKTTFPPYGCRGLQWAAMARIVDENAQLPPPHEPTTSQLVGLSLRSSQDLLARLQQRFNKETAHGEQVSVSTFFEQFRIFVEEVSMRGDVPEEATFAGHESDATIAVSPRNSISSPGSNGLARDNNSLYDGLISDEIVVAIIAPKPVFPTTSAADDSTDPGQHRLPHNSVSSSGTANHTEDDTVMETAAVPLETVATVAPTPVLPAPGPAAAAAAGLDRNAQNQQAAGPANDSADPSRHPSSEAMDFTIPSSPGDETMDDIQLSRLIESYWE